MIALRRWPRWARNIVESHPTCVSFGVQRVLGEEETSPNVVKTIVVCENVCEDVTDGESHVLSLTNVLDSIREESADGILLTEGIDQTGRVHETERILIARLTMPGEAQIAEVAARMYASDNSNASNVATVDSSTIDDVTERESLDTLEQETTHSSAPVVSTGEASDVSPPDAPLLNDNGPASEVRMDTEAIGEVPQTTTTTTTTPPFTASGTEPAPRAPDVSIAEAPQTAEPPSSHTSLHTSPRLSPRLSTPQPSPRMSPKLSSGGDTSHASNDDDIPEWLRTAMPPLTQVPPDTTSLKHEGNLVMELIGVVPPGFCVSCANRKPYL